MWNASLARRLVSWLAAATLALGGLVATPAQAQDDPPGRVGRVVEFQGGALWFDHEQGQWVEVERNRPLTTGDRISTAPEGRAELRVGSTVLRLGGASELEVLRLDDERLSFQLHSGSLALRVRSREVAGEILIVTAEARLQPQRAGHYRFDRIDDTTQAGSWRGELVVEDAGGFIIATGQRTELWRQRPRGELRQVWNALPDDDFARWVARDDGRDERSASSQYVSPEMTGAEELDRAGRWDRHPEYGAIWVPLAVRVGWAPYRYGRWAWVRPWGWTWVDDAPWGFAPFHYGRWMAWNGRWGWVPGVYVPRPVFAPALVGWVGGGNWGVSVNVGGPAVGWLPLGPREVYVPSYRHTPGYHERINIRPPGDRPGPPRPPRGHEARAVPYLNQNVPGAVTVVPRDALTRRQPVPRVMVDLHDGAHGADRRLLAPAAPPQGPQIAVSPPLGAPVGPVRPPRLPDASAVDEPRRERAAAPAAAVPAVPPTPRLSQTSPSSSQSTAPSPSPGPQPSPQPQPKPSPPPQHARPQPQAQPAPPVAAPVAAPVPAIVAAPQVMGPARPAAPPAAAPAAPPAAPPATAQAPAQTKPQTQPQPHPAERDRGRDREEVRKRQGAEDRQGTRPGEALP